MLDSLLCWGGDTRERGEFGALRATQAAMDEGAVDYTRSLYDRHANKAETKDEVSVRWRWPSAEQG